MATADGVVTENPFGQPRLSVAVLTHRRQAGLARLLAALKPQVAGKPWRDVVVVNDGSHDAAYDAVVAPFADVVQYHARPHHGSISAARNVSIALTRGTHVVFTDDDCVPPDHWLDWLEARLDANPELDVVIGTTRPDMPASPSFFERVTGHFDLIPVPHGPPSAPHFVTANVAIRRSLLDEVGGFGPRLSPWAAGEDTELSSRLHAAGARAVVDPNWYVRHDVSDGLVRQVRRYWRYGYANVKLTAVTSTPAENAAFLDADRRRLPAYALAQLRDNLHRAEGFSRWRAGRWLGAAAASIVRTAFYDGCAVAAADRRRALRA